jgi:SNF2 family DNA or RNA helicase
MLHLDQLHDYQKKLIEMSLTRPHMGLLMDMGLGKTVTALTIASKNEGPTLVIGPKAVIKNVWKQEAENWSHLNHLTFAVILGAQKERLSALKTNCDFYLINCENVSWLFEQSSLPKWKNLIIDESSRFKNPSSKRWKTLKGKLPSFNHRYILTGTPTPKSYLDLWCQLGVLDLGQRLGKSMTTYKTTYFDPDQMDRRTKIVWSWKLKPQAKEKIDTQIADICVSLKAEDYLKMPERTDVVHTIQWEPSAVATYKQMKKDMVANVDDEVLTASSAGVLTGKLLQLTSGEIYNEDEGTTFIHDSKVDFLEDVLAETPTLVFYNFKHSLKRLKTRFPDAIVLNADDTTTIENWRAGRVPVLLCHPKSVGIGLNLQCNVGDTAQIVWFDLPWSSEDYLQANARVFRQGQTKPVIIHHLAMDKSIDNQVLSVLKGKITIQDALMNALKLK